jgi:hypothetical protein
MPNVIATSCYPCASPFRCRWLNHFVRVCRHDVRMLQLRGVRVSNGSSNSGSQCQRRAGLRPLRSHKSYIRCMVRGAPFTDSTRGILSGYLLLPPAWEQPPICGSRVTAVDRRTKPPCTSPPQCFTTHVTRSTHTLARFHNDLHLAGNDASSKTVAWRR